MLNSGTRRAAKGASTVAEKANNLAVCNCIEAGSRMLDAVAGLGLALDFRLALGLAGTVS